MKTIDPLLLAILRDPDDDVVRGAYADHWEESGKDSDRAVFIRVQLEGTAREVQRDGHRLPYNLQRYVDHRCLIHADGVSQMARETLKIEQGHKFFSNYTWNENPDATVVCHCYGEWKTDEGIVFTYRRGFVESVKLSLEVFTEDFARKLFSSQPVTKVELVNKGPHDCGSAGEGWPGWMWCSDGENPCTDPWALPGFLFDKMSGYVLHRSRNEPQRERKHYQTEKDGLSVLSLACVNWGRSLVPGLPPLTHCVP